MSQLDCNNPKIKGSGVVTCLTSIYIASKYSVDPQNGLLEIAFFEGSDTDTNAAATGGLLGAIYGTSWIKEEWYNVQDTGYISLLAETVPDSNIPDRKDMWSLSDSEKFYKEIEVNSDKNKMFKLGSFNELKIIDKYLIKSKTYTKEIFVLKNDLSPTFYCKMTKQSNEYSNIRPDVIKSEKNTIYPLTKCYPYKKTYQRE